MLSTLVCLFLGKMRTQIRLFKTFLVWKENHLGWTPQLRGWRKNGMVSPFHAGRLQGSGWMSLRMAQYKHNHLLFLSNPLVEPDNNLCGRKAQILKGKINQAISLRSFEHLTYFCECLSVIDHFATSGQQNLYQSVKEVFKKPKPAGLKS